MRIAILFPGQGAQYVGMGKELHDYFNETREVFDKANEILGWDVKKLCFEGPEEKLNQTRYTQLALFITNYGIWKALEIKNIKVEATLGFSLGEYDAIAASGALSFEDTLRLVDKRACYMDQCATRNPGGMCAVTMLEIEKIKEICDRGREESGEIIAVANDNCKGQVTVAGTTNALDIVTPYLKEAGARRIVPLKVSGAFHSPLMQEAADKLKEEAEKLDFRAPQISIISNFTAKSMNQEEIVANIPYQITNGVRFRESIMYLLEQGIDTFIEVGPKCVLSKLVKKINKDVNIFNIEDLASFTKTIEALGEK